MPIKIPNDLPARPILENEHIFVMTETRALTQDIRPLRIGIVNLMPTKIATETQLLRCLANTPLQIEVDLIHTQSYTAKNTSEEHLSAFYRTFEDIKSENYDGIIITRAWKICHLRQWNIGRSFARLWNGRKLTYTAPCTSAGPRKPAFIIITACPSSSCPAN